jgi:hypothetical protein
MIGSDEFRPPGSGRRHHTKRDKPVAEETPDARAGRCRLAMTGAKVKEVSEFVMSPAKAIRRGGVSKSPHRAISAFDPTMILFDPIVEIPVGPVLHAATQDRLDGARVAVMPVRGHSRRGHAGDRSGGTEERVRRRHVTLLGETHVHQSFGPINRPI